MKDYSKIFDHYYGLQYDNNVNAVIKVHELMEKAGVELTATTKQKLDAYSDKRPFKVHYFISKQGKKLKWCPTASEDKLHRMSLKPAEWWIAQLEEDHVVSTPAVNIPNNWLDEQARHILSVQISSSSNPLRVRAQDDQSMFKTIEIDTVDYVMSSSGVSVDSSDDYAEVDNLPF